MKTVIDRLRDMREVELLLATDCDCRPEDTQNWQNAATLAEAIDMLAAPPQPVPAEPPDMRFRLRMARLLAELHGDEYLSEQQCARYMGIDLVSWRRLERCFTAGAHFVEGEGEEFPSEDSETVLRAALAATEAMSGEQEASAPPRLQPRQDLRSNLQCLASNPQAAFDAFGLDWMQAVANSALAALALPPQPVPAEPPLHHWERWCLLCDKFGHLTTECHSTHGLNTPAARELHRLCRLAHAATPLVQPAQPIQGDQALSQGDVSGPCV
jgi:hypothetical protein